MLLMKTWHRAALIVVCVGLPVAFLAWLGVRDPGINFLSRDARAEWILFPSAVQARAHSIVSLDTLFRRAFTLDTRPRTAQLNVRAAKRIDLKINGVQVPLGAKSNWKNISTVDVLALLRVGTNTIDARVFNADAPPALWLSLCTDHVTLRSDQTWEASFTGSAWCWQPYRWRANFRFRRKGLANLAGFRRDRSQYLVSRRLLVKSFAQGWRDDLSGIIALASMCSAPRRRQHLDMPILEQCRTLTVACRFRFAIAP